MLDATLDHDLTTKAELYATAGVPEYWVLDVNARELHVFRDPQPLPATLGATVYQTHTTHPATDSVSPTTPRMAYSRSRVGWKS